MKILRFVPAICIFLLIATGIYLSNSGQGSLLVGYVKSLPYGDKLGHFILFGGLAFSLNFALRLRCFCLYIVPIPIGSFAVLSFAILEELTQLYIPSRSFDLLDIYSDVAGVTLFTILNYLPRMIKAIIHKEIDSLSD